MAKKQKTTKSEKQQMNQTTTKSAANSASDDYLLKMSYYEGRSYKLQMIPATFFTAFVIMITRMYTYNRDMSQFFWTNQSENLTDFFSHYKLVAIVICAIVALLMLLFRFITQSLYIVRSKYYIPALVYVVFVLLSLAFSKYHNFAWFGANDRFDGTLAILCYFVLFFYIINTINSRTSLKWLLYPLCASVILLSLLGLTQALDVDFFRTTLGQKLLVPNVATEDGGTTWALIDQAKQNGELFLKFTFQNKEIYQTVYNINYVSYYLTLLVPLFAFLFLRENSIPKKVFWGFMELCVMFNILGASSSGGLVGLAVAFFVTIFVFNKTLLKWWKNLIVLFVIIAIAAIPTASHWIPDIASGLGVENPFSKDMPKSASEEGATASADNADTAKSGDVDADADKTANDNGQRPPSSQHQIDYIETEKNFADLSYDGKELSIKVGADGALTITGNKDNQIDYSINKENGQVELDSTDYDGLEVFYGATEDETVYLTLGVAGEARNWPLIVTEDGLKYQNDLGNQVSLKKVPSAIFTNHPSFGSGRGYIWSRAIPLIKHTIFVGTGADTTGLVYPHNDYLGKYNAGWNINAIVDKPHSFYIATAIGTGVISLIALLALFIMYIISSYKLYHGISKRNEKAFDTLEVRVGAGLFIGITAFVVSSSVDDSTVSVMPLFYGLLATGIAVNALLNRHHVK